MSDVAPLLALLDAAATEPERADLEELWRQFAAVSPRLSPLEYLQIGGQLIERLAGLYEAKATLWLDDWEEGSNTAGPIFTDDLLQGMVRQTQVVDVSPVTRPAKRSPRHARPQGESVVGEVDKARVLTLVDALDSEEPLMVAHDENVSGWVGAVAGYLETVDLPVTLLCLHQALDLSLIQLWLALLLGGYSLEQQGEFYDVASILVDR